MATFRERPYMQFNFLVDLGDGVTEGPKAGVQDVGGMAWRSPLRSTVLAIQGKQCHEDHWAQQEHRRDNETRCHRVRWISISGWIRSGTGTKRPCAL